LRQFSFAKKLKSQTAIREKLRKALWNEKGVHKMLMKLTPMPGHLFMIRQNILSFKH